MKIPRLKIILAITIFAALVFVTVFIRRRQLADAQRYANLHRIGESYQRAWTGQPHISERITAMIHLSNPSNYYRDRFDTDRQALVASGYLVEIARPVPDLRAKLAKVRVSLSNTLRQTGAYYEARLDHAKNEVRLLCRQEDIPLWEKVLKDYQ